MARMHHPYPTCVTHASDLNEVLGGGVAQSSGFQLTIKLWISVFPRFTTDFFDTRIGFRLG